MAIYDPFREPGEVLYFSCNGTVKEFRAGETYYVIRAGHSLTVSEVSNHASIGLLSAAKKDEYCPLKKLSFQTLTLNGTPKYMPTMPVPLPKPGKRKSPATPKGENGRPLLMSHVHFDLNERIKLYNREHIEDSLEFKVSDTKPF